MEKITPVLLAGGSGTRLWPMSRKGMPKQFKTILNKKTLFQETVERLKTNKIINYDNPLIITNSDFRFIIVEQLKQIKASKGTIFLEPEAKNTGPAILAASLHLYKYDKNSIILMSPTDHLIPETNKFQKLISNGMQFIKDGNLVVFGIRPDRPETGYGYIELNKFGKMKHNSNIKRFIEKPSIDLAKKIYSKNNFFWNSGLILFRARDLIDTFLNYHPKIYENVKKSLDCGVKDLGFFRLDPVFWSKSINISIDYAILEKANNIVSVPYEGKWSDLGDWRTVWKEQKKDKNGVVTSGNVTHLDCQNVLLKTEEDGPQLVGIGLENLIAIAMKDAFLISDKNRSQDVKLLVQKLKRKRLPEAEYFPRDYRPWGWFEVLNSAAFYKVKKILVNPNSSLSLQSHKYRSEHWVIVRGVAEVTLNQKVKLLNEGESIFIPVGAKHRLSNRKNKNLIIIEIQTGTYFGEDDIIRYDDNYGRKIISKNK